MATVFCCSAVQPYRHRRLDHEDKFTSFVRLAKLLPAVDKSSSLLSSAPYAVQVVRQVNYGPQEWIRYFVPSSDGSKFTEASEGDLVEANFEKLNSYKNFRCEEHNKFFEINLYQKSPKNKHHWRANLARPAGDIDLAPRPTALEVGLDRKDTSKAPEEHLISRTSALSLQSPTLPAQQPAAEFDMKTLKVPLQIALPSAVTAFHSNGLVSLLSLEMVNEKLDLELNFEDLWDAELNSSSIIDFCLDCLELPAKDSIDLADVEALVVPAMGHAKSLTGRARLQEIVDAMLESGRAMPWVRKAGADIKRVLASGPDERLLERCQRKNQDLRRKMTDSFAAQLTNVLYSECNMEDRELIGGADCAGR